MLGGRRFVICLSSLLALLFLAPPVIAHDDGYVSPIPTIASGSVSQVDLFSPIGVGFWIATSLAIGGAGLFLTRRRVLLKGHKFKILPLLVVMLFTVSSAPLSVLSVPTQPSSQTLTATRTVSYSEDFASGYDRGWSVQPGIPGTPSVQVVLDGGSRVLGARGSSGGGFVVNYLEGQEWQDVYFQTRVKGINGSVQDIVFRKLWTASNFSAYHVLLDYGGGHVQLGKFLQAIPNPGSLSILAQSDYALSLGTWYSVTVNATGSKIKVSVNSQQLIDYTDPSPLLSGTIGFENGDAYAAMNIGALSVTASVPPQSTWQQLNGPNGGEIGNIAIDPFNPNIIYAAAIHTGLMKSTNKGDFWREVAYSNGVAGTKVADVALAPTNSSVIYITILDTASGGGAWRSDDGGQHWRQLLRGNPGFYLFSIAVSPTDPNLVYAGTQTGIVPGSEGTASIYKSIDGGDTWNTIYTAQVQHIVISKSNPNTIYVGSADKGVLKSTDGGVTWRQMNNGILSSDIPPGAQAPKVDRVIVDPTNPDVAMIHLGENSLGGRAPNTGNVYITKDGGNSWTLTMPQLSPNQIATAVGMAPSNNKVLYVAGVDFTNGTGLVWRSADQGNTWSLVNSGSVAGVPQVMAMEPANANSLYMGTLSKGVYRSQDGGATWARVDTGFVGGGVYAVAVSPSNSNVMFAADGVSTWANTIPYHGYLTKSTDGGVTWQDVPNSPARVSVIQFDPTNPSVIYAGTGGPSSPNSNGVGVYKSTDGGKTWVLRNSGMGNVSISSLMINASNTNIILAGTGHRPYSGTEGSGIFRSTDGGQTWKKVNFPSLSVPAIVMNPRTPSIVYSATMGGGVYKSIDGGLNWAQINSGISDLMIYGLAINPNQPNVLYAGSSPFYGNELNVNGLVYETTNAGTTWKAVISPGDVEWVFVDPVNPNYVYVVEHAGNWFWTPDGGTNWLIGSQTLTRIGGHAYPFAAAIDSASRSLYVGTCGRGVFVNHLAQLELSLPTWLKVRYSSGTFNTLFKSNSSLSNFVFDQVSKSLAFTVTGNAGTRALTNVTLPTNVVIGPYAVTVDGSPVTPTSTSNVASNMTSLIVSYTQNGKPQQLRVQATSVTTATSSQTTTSTTSTTTSRVTASTSATSTSTTSTTTTTGASSATSTTPSQTSSTTVITTQTTTPSTSSTTTASSGGGGIPEFPYQLLALSAFTFLLVVSYLLVRHRWISGGLVGRSPRKALCKVIQDIG